MKRCRRCAAAIDTAVENIPFSVGKRTRRRQVFPVTGILFHAASAMLVFDCTRFVLRNADRLGAIHQDASRLSDGKP
jgi:hypothetical protein